MIFDRLNTQTVQSDQLNSTPWKPGNVVLGATYCTCTPYRTESAKDVSMIFGNTKPNNTEERLILSAIKTEALILRMILVNGGTI